jgi:perosamine synthetase
MDLAQGAEAYPRPRIPLFPVISPGTFTSRGNANIPSVLDARWVLPVTYGRMAIALSLRDLGIARGERVLIPAYHCLSMVDPVLWTGAQVDYYRIREDTSVDLDDVRSRIGPKTRVLMISHYFGFPQDMKAIRELCDATGLILIEDCAHAFHGEFAGAPLGSFGDYTIASPMKFFPIYDGGLLSSSRRPLDRIRLVPLGWKFSLRAAVILLERSIEYRRWGPLRSLLQLPLWLKTRLVHQLKRARPGGEHGWEGGTLGERSSGRTGDFDPRWVDRRMSQTSRAVIRLASKSRTANARRRNYRVLLEGLSDIPGSRPLFPTLPDGVVPFAFPLVVEDPVPLFDSLKRQGVPMMRFGEFLADEVDPRSYPETIELSRRVFQFPCHQEMKAEELDWLVRTVRTELLSRAKGRPAERGAAGS